MIYIHTVITRFYMFVKHTLEPHFLNVMYFKTLSVRCSIYKYCLVLMFLLSKILNLDIHIHNCGLWCLFITKKYYSHIVVDCIILFLYHKNTKKVNSCLNLFINLYIFVTQWCISLNRWLLDPAEFKVCFFVFIQHFNVVYFHTNIFLQIC